MPRLPRARRWARERASEPVPADPPPGQGACPKPPSQETPVIKQALCPVCGRAVGYLWERDPIFKTKLRRINYWEKTKEFVPDKPFGVIQQAGMANLRGFQVLGHFNPEEDTEGFFPLVRARLLEAVKEWLEKGWLTREEVESILGH